MNNIANQISDQTRDELFLYYSRIPNTGFHPDYVRKRMGLLSLGMSVDEVERMCEPRKVDWEAEMRAVKAEQKLRLRELDRLNQKNAGTKLF